MMAYSRTVSSKSVPLALIADPVRLRILRRLEREGPTGLDQLADAAGVHVNTVRTHVTPLEEAGVLVREHAQTGARGRPPLRYALAPGWRMHATDLIGLTELLAATLAALDPKPAQLQAIGHDWGRWLGGRPGAQELSELLPDAMAALGFEASLSDGIVELTGCPCAAMLPDRPEILCRLAAAVVDGLAATAQDRLAVEFSTHDPATRRCVLRLGEQRPARRVLPLRLRRARA
jgi:predicted ArsR family transcriptional regulator